jgi:hypothetical protein
MIHFIANIRSAEAYHRPYGHIRIAHEAGIGDTARFLLQCSSMSSI